MTAAPLVLRVFLSSPGDVADERRLAGEVLAALQGSHLLKHRMRFEIVAWDDAHAAAPMDAAASPQDSVNRYAGRPAECDVTLVFLWSRIGTPMPPDIARRDGTRYESGTVWEFEDAFDAGKTVFIYRRTETPKIDLDDAEFDLKRAQYAAVKAFVGRFTAPDGSLRGGITSYAALTDFSKLLRQHLEAFVNERLAEAATAAPATRIAPDDPEVSRILALIDELARKNRQLDEKESEIAALREANDALRRAAIARTLTAAAQPEASAEARAAGQALEVGNTRPAEVLLRSEERTAASPSDAGAPASETDRVRAAELACEQGALALGRDVRAALKAYLRAVDYDPNDVWTRFRVGDLQLKVGDSNAAMKSYRAGMKIAEAHAASDPADLGRQRALNVGHDRVGDAHRAQGNLAAALTSYEAGMVISRKLADRDPGSELAMWDLSVSHDRVGDTQRALGDLQGALKNLQAAMTLRQKLVASDPANTEWQRLVSVSHSKIGDIQNALGDRDGALTSYRADIAIARTLAQSDPSNTEWQRDLSLSHDRIGTIERALKNLDAALESYRAGMAILVELVASDPSNTEWQRDLGVSHDQVGDTLNAQGLADEALASHRASMAIKQTLAAMDPSIAQWQRDLSVSYNRIGGAQRAQGDLAGALTSFQADYAIATRLSESDPDNIQWQVDVASSTWTIGTLDGSPQGKAERRELLKKGLAVLEGLQARQVLGPAYGKWPDAFRKAIADLADAPAAWRWPWSRRG